MKKIVSRLLSLLLVLSTVFSMLPAAFAAELPSDLDETVISESEEIVLPEAEPEVPEVQPEEPAEPEVPEVQPEEPAEPEVPEVQPEEPAEPEVPEVQPEEPAEPEIPEEQPEEDLDEESDAVYAEFPASSVHPKLRVTGVLDFDAANQLMTKLNNLRAEKETLPLMIGKSLTSAASVRAAELSLLFDNSTRPCGEDWTTVLGDASIQASAQQSIILRDCNSVDAAYAQLSSKPEILSSDYTVAGVGCFHQEKGGYFWCVLLIKASLSNLVINDYSGADTKTLLLKSESLVFDQIQLSPSPVNLPVLESTDLLVRVKNGSSYTTLNPKSFEFKSSQTSVCTVSETGRITAVTPGSAVVTVTCPEYPSLSLSANVTSSLNLTTPELVSAVNGKGGINFTWKAVPSATHYDIYRSTNPNSFSARLTRVPASQVNYLDTTVQSGTSYYYTVRAVHVGATTTISGFVSPGIGTLYLAAPQLTVTSNTSGISLSWKKPAGVASFRVYRKVGNASQWTFLTATTGTSYVDYDITKNVKYTYTVTSLYNNFRSAVENSVSVTAAVSLVKETHVVIGDVKYRKGPGTNYAVQGTLAKNTKVTAVKGLTKTVNGTSWTTVLIGGNTYYIMSRYLLGVPHVTAAKVNYNGIQVSWEKPANAESYIVYRKMDNASKWTRIADIKSGNTLTYLDKDANLVTGHKYSYTVVAVKGTIRSTYETGVTANYLQSPKLLSAASTGSSITVRWQPVANAAHYRVYRKTGTGSWQPLTMNCIGTTFVDSKATAMTTYKYTVRAVTSAGAVSAYDPNGIAGIAVPANKLTDYVTIQKIYYREGAGTDKKAVGTLNAGSLVKLLDGTTKANNLTWARALINGSLYYVATEYLVGTPALKKTAADASGIVLTWDKAHNAQGYNVYRKTASTGYRMIARLGNVTSYTDTSVSSGTVYTYTVRAVNNNIQGRYVAAGISHVFLSAPNLTSINSTNTGITINWSYVSGASGYRVYRKLGSGAWTRIADISSANTLSYKDKNNLLKDVNYSYTVRAISGEYYSDYNSPLTAQAKATINPSLKTYTATAQVNVRSGPGLEHSVLSTLKKDAKVSVVVDGSVKVGDITWLMVYVNGKYGYVSSNYLKS